MSRCSVRRIRVAWAILSAGCALSLAVGCGRATNQVAQTDESQGQPVPSSETNSTISADPSPQIELGDYEKDPDYRPYAEEFSDGRRKLDGGFRHGKRQGVWTYYRAFNGNIMRVERYRDGELLSME